ncbi:ABC transporter permease [Magnetovibrio blakemorei]|uniref:ABC transporter permease n=1 Tax=Magnetovibrio blakemorei TaxID=28181 RepID=A0A1E5Q7Z0_9PROT|nr:ABC transporter permease [Magnetovibrio blakemorei]OEJ67168.1 ABC transporter permease [Magnetovibrio blakemorei]
MNLAYRDIKHNLGRFLLTCFGLSLLLGVVLSMIGIYRGLVDDALTLVRAPNADIWVVETGTLGPFAEASRIPGNTREDIARIAGVTAAGAMNFQSVQTQRHGQELRLYVVGYELGHPGGPINIVEGRNIGRDRYEAVADLGLGVKTGETLQLGRTAFKIVGLTEGMVASGGDPLLYMTLRDSQQLQFELSPSAVRKERARGARPGSADTVNAVVAQVSANIAPETVVQDIKRWKHLAAMSQVEQETLLTQSVVDRARKQIGLFTAILLVVSAVIIALIVYTMTMDKIREIATLKLIGAPDRTIIGMVIQQSVAMGVIGFGFGALLIVNIKDYFPRRVVLQPEDGLALAGVILIVCLLSSALGVRLALKIDPASAMGG